MMPRPSTSNGDCGHPFKPARSHHLLETSQDNVASQRWNQQDCQSGPHVHDDKADFIQAYDDRNSYNSGRNLKPSSALNPGYKASHNTFTAQTRPEHELQQEIHSQHLNAYDSAQRLHATGLETVFLTTLDDPTNGLQENDMRRQKSMFLEYPLQRTLKHQNQTQNWQQKIASIHVEHNLSISACETSDRWSPSSHEEHTTVQPKYDDNDTEVRYENINQLKGLTIWGNDLAGVGAQFDERSYQDYDNSNENDSDQYSPEQM